MSSKTKRLRQEINLEAIDQLKGDFSFKFKEPKHRSRLRLRDVVALMQDQLQDALDKNWSYQDCCELFAERGIKISPDTLQQYLRDLKSGKGSDTPVQIRRSESAATHLTASNRPSQTATKEKTSSKSTPLPDHQIIEAAENEPPLEDIEKRFNVLDRRRL